MINSSNFFDFAIFPFALPVKSLINEQGGYVFFLVLSEYSFIRDFRVYSKVKNI